MAGRARVFIASSLDGFIAGEDDDLSWLPEPTEDEPMEDHGYEAFMAEVRALSGEIGCRRTEQAR